MEATIQSTNRAINIDVNVSINVAALKTTIQHGLQAIKQRMLQAVKQATKKCCNVGAWSLPLLYRKELRLARVVTRVIDAHPTLSNIFLWMMGIGIMVEIFMFV